MKINKLFVLVFMTLICIFPINVNAATYTSVLKDGAKSSVNISSVSVDGRENQTNTKGYKPNVTSDDFSTDTINDTIDSIYTAMTKDAASDRAKSIDFNYDVYQSKGYISIVINSTIKNATTTQKIDSVNFSTSDGSLIDLTDVIGGKPIDIIDKYVNKSIKDEGQYYTDVDLDNSSNFYMYDNVPTVTFDSYSLGQNQSQAMYVPIDLSDITSYQLSSVLYYTKDKFNIRMIPLRKTCEGLYYDVKWDANTKSFTVSDETTTSTGSVNSNIYTSNNKKTNLECTPELIDGSLYVPISYFSDVLDISYEIGDNGNITFYKLI